VLDAEPAPLRVLRAEIPEELEHVVLRCLQKERTARYPSLDEFTGDLVTFAAPEAAVSVERVSRVLGRSPPRSRRTGPDSGPRSDPGTRSDPGGLRSARLNAPTLPATHDVAVKTSPSVSLVSTTGGAGLDTPAKPPRRSSKVGWIAAVVLAGAVGAVVVMRMRPTTPDGAAPAAEPAAESPRAPAQAAAPQPVPVVPTAAAEPTATASASATAAAAAEAPGRPKRVPGPLPPRSARPGAASAAPAAAPDAWDRDSFGGRR
jgi:eukaryotic-like serine/threonine-protein kinase